MTKVFITRHALTGGIRELEAEIRKTMLLGKPYVKDDSGTLYYIDKDAFLDKLEAINKAKNMRDKKIASLRKQIDKLEKIIFI